MVSSIEKTGGVSKHSTSIMRELKNFGADITLYSMSPQKEYSKIVEYLIKGYKKTFGVLIKSIRLKNKVSIVHLHCGGSFGGFLPAISIILIRKRLGFVKLVITYHGISMIQKSVGWMKSSNPLKKLVGITYQGAFSYVLKNTNAFIVVSRRQKNAIIQYLGEKYESKIIVLPNGFNEKFKVIDKRVSKEVLGLPSNKKIILNLGNLIKVKGQEYLLEAAREIMNFRKDIIFVVAGQGKMQRFLEDYARKLGIEGYVIFTGYVPDEKLPHLFNSADLFVLSSLIETFGIVQIEAMACGKPVVATRNGGSEEVVVSEDYGLLCEPANSRDLADKILIALAKDWDTERILGYARKFTWNNVAEKMVEIYNGLLY